jgi:hypothetical protein
MKLTKTKRYFRWLRLKTQSYFKIKGPDDKRYTRPKKLSDTQTCALDIAVKSIHDPSSKLYFDMHTQECYVKTEDEKVGTIYVFIEERNLKIINTVFGYDIYIDMESEAYITQLFSKEMSKRRAQFKKEALSKVDHSLHKVLDKLNEK